MSPTTSEIITNSQNADKCLQLETRIHCLTFPFKDMNFSNDLCKAKKRKWKSLQEIYQRPGRKCLSLDLGEMCHLDSEVAQGFFYIKIINPDGLKIRPNFTDFSVQSAHDQGHFQSIVKK